jgi:very-short-patch-repair endonuclease
MPRLTVPPPKRRAIVERARALRRDATPPERLLWERLRNRQVGGVRVRRQQPIGPFIVDFFVPAAKLVIEIDGTVHEGDDGSAQDRERERLLAATGLRLLRFRNAEVLADLEAVLARVRAALTPRPPLLPKGEGGTSA